MATLVHVTAGDGVAGVWRAEGSGVVSHYRVFAGAAKVRERARTFLDPKAERVGWGSWFEQLARRTPYGPDTFVLLEEDGESLEEVLDRAAKQYAGV